MNAVELNRKRFAEPFRPFSVLLNDGSSIPVLSATPMLVINDCAILPTEIARDDEGYAVVKRWRTVALAEVVKLSDLAKPKRPKSKRRK
jgi:hypothetical protein